MPEYTKEEMTAATSAVLDRMMELGWLNEIARNDETASIAFTRDGEIARKMMRGFLAATHSEIEATAFLCLISNSTDAGNESQ